jgi:peptidoglycan/xylan/chitin deacetylase (PgdA/CDA1 family)
MGIGQKIAQVTPFFIRHIMAHNNGPYERLLQYLRVRPDIWIVSQGGYMTWWSQREEAELTVTVSEGQCRMVTLLENAVIEKFPGTFLDEPVYNLPETTYSGPVWITIHQDVEKQDLLAELLKREGILNIRVASEGDFILSQSEVGQTLDEIHERMDLGRVKPLEPLVLKIRQLVLDKLAAHNLPLFRIWYHPRLNGQIMKAAFSARYDVDRAISNLPAIRALEEKYDVTSTLYIRTWCPFYTEQSVKELVSKPWCSEIALHGEFVTHADQFGGEVAAAVGEKEYLEQVSGRSVKGVAMHGGELTLNKSEQTDEGTQIARFLYDTTVGPTRYYFPFKKIVRGEVSPVYNFPHAMSDVSLFPFRPEKVTVNGKTHRTHSLSKTLSYLNEPTVREYGRLFYETAVQTMEAVYAQNGIFVLTMHPSYFGFFSYLARPKNWTPLVKFSLGYLKQSR